MRFPPSLRKWRNKQKNADCRVASLLAMTEGFNQMTQAPDKGACVISVPSATADYSFSSAMTLSTLR